MKVITLSCKQKATAKRIVKNYIVLAESFADKTITLNKILN